MNAINNTENFAISSDLFPCVCVAMYGTRLDSSVYEEDMSDCYSDSEHPFSYFTVDRDTWELEIIDRAGDFINERVVPIMQKYGLAAIQVETIHSPRFYNFENDCLYFTVSMSEGWREQMHAWLLKFRQQPKFTDYIRQHWHSCSGFISFMPETFDEIEAFEDEARCIGAYLTLCLLNEDAIGLADEFVDETVEWLYENSSAGSSHNVLDDYLDDPTEADRYTELYNNDFRIDCLCHDLYDRQGHLWRGCDSLTAKKDCGISFTAENEAMRMIFWAVQKGYTVAVLYQLAA